MKSSHCSRSPWYFSKSISGTFAARRTTSVSKNSDAVFRDWRRHRSIWRCVPGYEGGLVGLIYFIRHAQAGARDNYDILSDLGQKQARLLGKFLATEDVRFSA